MLVLLALGAVGEEGVLALFLLLAGLSVRSEERAIPVDTEGGRGALGVRLLFERA